MSSTSERTAMTRLDERDVVALLDFANEALPTLRRADGWFCFDRRVDGELRGESRALLDDGAARHAPAEGRRPGDEHRHG